MISSIIIKNNPVVTRPYFMQSLQPDEFTGYNHDIRAMGGFWSCKFSMAGDLVDLEEYIENGLGRDIKAFDENGDTAFHGLIVELKLNLPNAEISISLLDMANRVQIRYLTASGGLIKRSTAYNDTASQALYGIKEKIFSGAIISSSTEVNQAAQKLLSQYKYPSSPINTPKNNSGGISLSIIAHGYVRTLDWRVYNQTVNTGTENISTQIAAVITAVGQFIASTSITANTSPVLQLQDADKLAWNVIEGATQLGDVSNNRYVVGVYEDRKLTYAQATGSTITDVNYITEALSESGDFYDRKSGVKLDMASIRPNKWVRYTDILGSLSDGTDLFTDPRATYIESVNYSDPDRVSITGTRGALAEMIMAKAGFGGVTV